MKIFSENPNPKSKAFFTAYLHGENHEVETRNIRPCIVICPGGGYRFVSDRENESPAMTFFNAGYQVFVLTYSHVSDEDFNTEKPLKLSPIADIAHTVIRIREKADEWKIDKNKICVCGFSSGGHVAGSLGTLWNKPELREQLEISGNEHRPNAMVLCYPVITGGEYAHKGSFLRLTGTEASCKLRDFLSLEKQVDNDAVPAFIWQTQEDQAVPVENSLMMAAALQKHHIPVEYHLFTKGIHGISMCNAECGTENNTHCAYWIPLCLDWVNDLFEF